MPPVTRSQARKKENQNAGMVLPRDTDPGMFVFNLALITDVLVKQIVEKFDSVRTGLTFMQTCRRAKNIVERMKASWPLPNSELGFKNQILCSRKQYLADGSPSVLQNQYRQYRNCIKISIEIFPCSEQYFKNTVLTEGGNMASVDKLAMVGKTAERRSEEEMKLLMAAVTPRILVLPSFYDLTSSIYKNVNAVFVYENDEEDAGRFYWETKKLFEFVRGKKDVCWQFRGLHKNAIVIFLQNWLKGEQTGSLQILTFCIMEGALRMEDLEELLSAGEIQNIMKSCERRGEDYVLERDGGERLAISLAWNNTAIIFFRVPSLVE